MINSRFDSNVAATEGGAVFIDRSIDKTVVSVSSCAFQNNTSGTFGGAVHTNIESEFRECSFDSNQATEDGGGIFVKEVLDYFFFLQKPNEMS